MGIGRLALLCVLLCGLFACNGALAKTVSSGDDRDAGSTSKSHADAGEHAVQTSGDAASEPIVDGGPSDVGDGSDGVGTDAASNSPDGGGLEVDSAGGTPPFFPHALDGGRVLPGEGTGEPAFPKSLSGT